MAPVILGKSTCCLCGQVLTEGGDAVLFPSLFYSERDPAWVLNDAGAHRGCLVQYGLADRALQKLREFENRRSSPKICAVCGRSITDPADYFSTGPLGDSPDDPLENISWIETHLSHLAGWERTPELVRVLEGVSHTPEWEGDVLERLIAKIRTVWTTGGETVDENASDSDSGSSNGLAIPGRRSRQTLVDGGVVAAR